MIGGLFLQFLDRDELNIDLCDVPTHASVRLWLGTKWNRGRPDYLFFAEGSTLSLLEQSLYLVSYV